MGKRSVYFVQPGHLYGSGARKSAYLPYAAGTVAAYAFSRDDISAHYTPGGFLYSFEDVDAFAQSVQAGSVVAFSNYVWNFECNKSLAQRIKTRCRECTIIFGGHNVAPGGELLQECDFIDFLIHGEGEEPFAQLLAELAHGQNFDDVPNISYRGASGDVLTTKKCEYSCIEYPSPYLTGMFDGLVAGENVDFSAIIETNRGCPYGCAYCDWGIIGCRVKKFPLERVFGELDWIAQHGIAHCFAADANFGLFERDAQIVDYIIEKKASTGYPEHFDVTYAKGQCDFVFKLSKKMFDAGLFTGPSISLQSLNDDALESIGRKNISMKSYSELLQLYTEAGIPVYSEMILGLPGETLDSFKRGLCALIESGQHNYVDVFRCELLVNAEMSRQDYRKKHGIESVIAQAIRHHVPTSEASSGGSSEIVVATDTMTREEWLEANVFALTVQSCHFMGLTRFAAEYVTAACGCTYFDFYSEFISFVLDRRDTTVGRIFSEARQSYERFARSGESPDFSDELFGDICWFAEEGVFLQCSRNLDEFYASTAEFLRRYINDEEMLSSLVAFERLMIKQPQAKTVRGEFKYDWYSYFCLGNGQKSAVEQRENILTVTDPCPTDDFADYARKNVWFGRRSGKTLYTHPLCKIEVAYKK